MPTNRTTGTKYSWPEWWKALVWRTTHPGERRRLLQDIREQEQLLAAIFRD